METHEIELKLDDDSRGWRLCRDITGRLWLVDKSGYAVQMIRNPEHFHHEYTATIVNSFSK